jgi:hypothetical protein
MATSLDHEGTSRALWIELAIRIALGSLVTWLFYASSGAGGLVFAAPVWGLLLAKPILELIPMLARGTKRLAWSEDGEVIAFGSHRLRVRYVAGYPWIVDEDLLAVLGKEGSDTVRRRADPANCAQLPDSSLWAYSEAGAVKYLSSSRHPDANKLRLLLERQVFLPARKKRERERSAE